MEKILDRMFGAVFSRGQVGPDRKTFQNFIGNSINADRSCQDRFQNVIMEAAEFCFGNLRLRKILLRAELGTRGDDVVCGDDGYKIGMGLASGTKRYKLLHHFI